MEGIEKQSYNKGSNPGPAGAGAAHEKKTMENIQEERFGETSSLLQVVMIGRSVSALVKLILDSRGSAPEVLRGLMMGNGERCSKTIY